MDEGISGKSSKSYSARGLVSFLTALGFLTMAVTGIILYITPHGRIAYWTNWQFLALTKDQWGTIHILSSYLFLIAGGFHLYYNWRPFTGYIVSRARGGLKLKKEIAVSTAVLVFVIVSSIYSIPPLIYIADLGEYIKDSWIVSDEHEPPMGHAELLPLKKFVQKTGLDLETSKQKLEAAGIEFTDENETLGEIAVRNGTSPIHIYSVIRVEESVQEGAADSNQDEGVLSGKKGSKQNTEPDEK